MRTERALVDDGDSVDDSEAVEVGNTVVVGSAVTVKAPFSVVVPVLDVDDSVVSVEDGVSTGDVDELVDSISVDDILPVGLTTGDADVVGSAVFVVGVSVGSEEDEVDVVVVDSVLVDVVEEE
jgi:hypothetical protein